MTEALIREQAMIRGVDNSHRKYVGCKVAVAAGLRRGYLMQSVVASVPPLAPLNVRRFGSLNDF